MKSEELQAMLRERPWPARDKHVARQLGGPAPEPLKAKRRSKYGAVATYVDGLRFASKREAHRYMSIKLRMEAGRVLWFCRQPRFGLPGGVEYVADFLVVWQDGQVTVEDSKGVRTKEYRLKKRQVEALYPFKIQEV